MTVGKCSYGKGQDGSWRKQGYMEEYDFKVPCGAVHLSSTPWALGSYRTGWRLGWADLGRPEATTMVPVLDEEANSFPTGENCNVATGSGCVGLYRQTGGAYGVALSGIAERKVGGFTFGAEAGFYFYRSWWYVFGEQPAPGSCKACGTSVVNIGWDKATANHTTYLLGVTAEYRGFLLHVRRYNAIYASDGVNSLHVGAISGPLVSVQIGYQWKWQ